MRKYELMFDDMLRLGADVFPLVRKMREKDLCEDCIARILEGLVMGSISEREVEELEDCVAENREDVFGVPAEFRARVADLFYRKYGFCFYPTYISVYLLSRGISYERYRDIRASYMHYLREVFSKGGTEEEIADAIWEKFLGFLPETSESE